MLAGGWQRRSVWRVDRVLSVLLVDFWSACQANTGRNAFSFKVVRKASF
jgi:hypothetical protein